MKNRLQTLWDEVAPHSGPCPQPDAASIRHRVDAALDGKPRAVSRRTLRLAALAMAAVLLLSGAALAGEQLIPPEFNVLSGNFRGENSADTIAMMSITPVSVEDANYTMTVTSSLADGNKLYFTLVVEPKNDAARERLRETDVADLLRFRVSMSNSYGMSSHYDKEADALLIDVSATWRPAQDAAIRLDLMRGDVWLNFPVKPVRSVTLKLNAETPGAAVGLHIVDPAPVTVDRVEISPLSYMLRYTAPNLDLYPVVYFLFQDGSIRTPSQLRASPFPSGGSDSGLFNEHPGRLKLSWQFRIIQDLSEIEAVVLGGTAYPLDGGEPYEVDVSDIPLPFVIPKGERFYREETEFGDDYVPLFALCDGLDADCRWDEVAGVAAATFRDVTLTFTVGSETVQVDGQPSLDTFEESAAPVYRDGELWVDGSRLFPAMWDVNLIPATDGLEKSEDSSSVFNFWTASP